MVDLKVEIGQAIICRLAYLLFCKSYCLNMNICIPACRESELGLPEY